MNLISANVGQERTLQRKDRFEKTGIFKLSTDKPVKVTQPGLEGDVILSRKHHGGPDQAIYDYGAVDYEWWSRELGKEISPGTFGENLTISELESAHFNVGDALHIGDVILQVTAPRIPCGTFAARMVLELRNIVSNVAKIPLKSSAGELKLLPRGTRRSRQCGNLSDRYPFCQDQNISGCPLGLFTKTDRPGIKV
jgi:MOSC domain-containing protein YiiM